MNYIWDIYLRGQEQTISFDRLNFAPARNPSPYIEASFAELNKKYLEDEPIEINSLYRFDRIFQPLLDINYEGDTELRMALFDIFIHYLTVMDLRQGLCKNEYYMLFLKYDTEDSVYGDEYKNVLRSFTIPERTWLLAGFVKAYEVGSSLELFRHVLRMIYPDSMVYFHTDTAQEILIYIGKEGTTVRKKQVEFLCSIFLSMDMSVYLYWLHHFGVMDIDDTMITDEMMIF